MSDPNILTVPPGQDIARLSAEHILEQLGQDGLPRAVVLVPNRRAATTLRDAFRKSTGGKPLLLPRILPIGDLADELLLLFGTQALSILNELPPAMPDWQRLCLLATQVQVFERARASQTPMRLELVMRLAADLAELQDNFTRAGRILHMEELRKLVAGDYAEHWQESLAFFAIIAEHWPTIERDQGMTTQAARQVAAAEYIAHAWKETPPDYPVIAVGSTASQPSTADLLEVIAGLPQGTVILPGFDATTDKKTWAAVAPGHPYFHLKSFLDRWPLVPEQFFSLGAATPPTALWLQVLASAEAMPAWRDNKTSKKEAWNNLRLIPCQHAEEEVRVIALLMREAAETPDKRTALITPDENLMDRVGAQLARYGITVDRLTQGTLATTATGSLLLALLEAMASPERVLPLLGVLRHELVHIGEKDAWQRWLAAAEPQFRGLLTQKPGELPLLPELLRDHPASAEVTKLAREIAQLSCARHKPSAWVKKLAALLAQLVPEAGEGQESIEEVFDSMVFADIFDMVDSEGFAGLLKNRLDQPWRGPAIAAHPNLVMLTPVEARLQQFDRVILANMQDKLWPGLASPGPWLNFAQQQTLGLPAPAEHVSLMSHDLLTLATMNEVFFTWPQREGGAPTTRSPFLERLVTFLALQGVKEEELQAKTYLHWARLLHAASEFNPEKEARPIPSASERPRELPVTVLDMLFSDPYTIYARHVLGLRPLEEIDAEPEAKDFGSLAHAAIQRLSQYWDEAKAPADEQQLIDITEQALARFRDRPNIRLFWRDRMLRALRFVNAAEAKRRAIASSVESEVKLRETVALGEGRELTLQGRIDRLEETKEGAVIVDYKTGGTFSDKDIPEGKKVQLLAYALLLSETGRKVSSLDYWELPRAGNAGDIHTLGVSDEFSENLLQPLKRALVQMLDPSTPFLARPVPGDERFDNDYDGISRYDEWAG